MCGSPEAEKATARAPDLTNFVSAVVVDAMTAVIQIAVIKTPSLIWDIVRHRRLRKIMFGGAENSENTRRNVM